MIGLKKWQPQQESYLKNKILIFIEFYFCCFIKAGKSTGKIIFTYQPLNTYFNKYTKLIHSQKMRC